LQLRDHVEVPVKGKGQSREGFGTFGGVFTPCTLTILGVIMFLRFGQVVGNGGVIMAIAIVLISKAITTFTALSLSAIATNTRVRGGGAYFLISRSLGPSFGGSIGIVFFLAQAVSVAMYVLGFTEALTAAFPDTGLSATALASLVNLGVFICVYIGAGWTIKLQYGILALLLLSLVSFFGGALQGFSLETFRENLGPGTGDQSHFFLLFALFFPAATGIMAGANMSGDLRDPSRSIPRGTLLAILFTGAVYVLIAVVLGGAASRDALQQNTMIMQDAAWVPMLITVGVFAATLSSALGSMMGAPRILQAVGKDQVFESLAFFGQGDGPNNEPRRATVITFAISECGIMLGDLNAIAPIITMFFMITYGYLNLATFYESIIRNPSYRPRFRFSHWSTALVGAVACGVVMFLTNPLWALIAIAAMGLLHFAVSRREVIATWGDAQSGAAFERARKALLRLETDRLHPKNWRPSIIAFSGGAWSRLHLAVYGYWLTASRGILTLAQVITGDVSDHTGRRRGQEEVLRRFIREEELSAFPAVLVAASRVDGIKALVQCHGVGAVRPNLALFGWTRDPEHMVEFGGLLRTIAELDRNIVIVRTEDPEADPWLPPRGPVDVWWRGKDNGHLMVLLGHLLTLNDAWRGRELRLLRVIANEAGQEETEQHLRMLLRAARITATPRVVVSDDPIEAIHRESADSAAVFLGFMPPEEGKEIAFGENMTRLMEGLGTIIIVWSAGEVRLEA
jgi:amino acid transporter